MSGLYARNKLAQAAINKIQNDERLRSINRELWYHLADIETLPQFQKFLMLYEDEETKEFLKNCYEKSDYFLTQFFHSLIMSMLKMFMATTSINGLLQRGSMFVFSVAQFKTLIEFDAAYNGVKMDSLLDLGAGDGAVTAKMAPFFNQVYATEMSVPMQWRLRQKGYTIFDVSDWDQQLMRPELEAIDSNFLKYDAISCLNLLDRCDTPIGLLKQIKTALKPNGLLIVALVLPFKPFVEYNKDNKPTEDLLKGLKNETTCYQEPVTAGASVLRQHNNNGKMMNRINFQIDFLIENIFEPLGFDLLRFTRLPYLCEGNMEQSFYYLHDYVFIFKSSI